MTAEQVLKTAQAAYDADRPLTQGEFQVIRDAINDPTTSPSTRGGLRELGDALTRQADARRETARVAEEQERGRQRLIALEEREQRWRALDPVAAALFNAMAERPGDPTLRILSKHLGSADRGPAPATFEPALVPEWQRPPGFFG